MGKFTRMVIKSIYNSWWLRGHLFVAIIIGLISYSLISNHGVTYALPHKQRGTIAYESPTRVLPTVLPRRTPTIKPTAKPTVKPIPTPIPTKAGVITATPTKPPVDNKSWYPPACYYVVTQYYGQNGEAGTDFGCGYHTRIGALWNGTVIYAGRTCWNVSCTNTSGGVVIIDAYIPHLGLESSYYLHLDELAAGLHKGQSIAKGEYIGLSGGQTTGGNWPVSPEWTAGPHLEIGFDAWFLCQSMVYCKGKNVNPLPYIQEAIP